VERLLHVETEDGVALAGAVVAPDSETSRAAIVWIHGNTGSFHDHPYVVVARELAARGYAVVLGNTRGHGVANSLWNVREDREIAGGSAWEQLEEAPRDVAAWVDEAARLGAGGVVVVGHSHGATKAVLHAAERADERVGGVVLASPDLHGHWSNVVREAEQLVSAGRSEELLPPLMGAPWYRLTAANVVSRVRVAGRAYAPDGPIASIRSPLLAFFAARDVGGEAELETIRGGAAQAEVQTAMLSGGDHVYTDAEAEAAELIARWIEAAVP
jgi:pimeloyl-ACP methyl ester carboxylesterase